MKLLINKLPLLFLLFIFPSFSIIAKEKSEVKSYYLSSTIGNDNNNGTQKSPWKTLSKINSVTLLPGTTVYFKKGDVFSGHFVVKGSGSQNAPILITSYGTGNKKPVISGKVGAEDGGDYQEAILVENCDNIIFDGLEVNNERIVSRKGIRDLDAYGLFVHNSGTEQMNNFIFRNMTFQNVYAVKPMLDPNDFDKLEVAALRVASDRNNITGKEKNIQNVLVENCYFTNIQRLGIHFKQGGAADGVGNDSINRIENIICRNNTFHYLGGSSILPQRTYNCLIENNIFDHPGASLDKRMPGRGSSVWTFHCINTVIQYNQCLSTRGYFDSHGIHIDHENENTFIQYNYMEDCEGGFVEILKGNKNAVYRFNVSVNDGWRKGGGPEHKWANSNHTIWVDNGDNGNPNADIRICDSIYIYNNTIVVDKPFTTAIAIQAKNTYIYNNIFYSVNGAFIGKQQSSVNAFGTEFFMKNNLFYGDIKEEFKAKDTQPKIGDPKFILSGEFKNKYKLSVGSAAINSGVAKTGPAIPNAGIGVFRNITAYPTVDYYGNPIDLSKGTPNIGACNFKK